MEKLTKEDGESPDLLADNIERLREIFPEVFSEGHVDFDALKQTLGEYVDDADERYSFAWHGKSRARQIAQVQSAGTLLPCPEESVNWDTTKNIFIEGDNLEVLKLLQKTYHRKVKMIYIDPPYNTGKEFIYPDKWQDNLDTYLRYTGQVDDEGFKLSANSETSGRYHTNWLNMMYPRLKLARNLLRDDGMIFVSIDDNEVSNLRHLCDEVFGEENFVDTIVWKKRYGGGAKEKHLVSLHEYVLVYARQKDTLPDIFIPLSEESIKRYYKSSDEHHEKRGPYRTHPLEAMQSFDDRANLRFPVKAPDGSEVCPKRQWRWSQARMEEALAAGEVEFKSKKGGGWTLSSKQYLRDEDGAVRQTKAFSVIDDVYTQHGTNEIVEIFGDAKIFDFPKPSLLMKKLIDIATDQGAEDLILDFFAGSAATAHGMFLSNLEGGRRRFLLVQLPEPTTQLDKAGNVTTTSASKAGFSTICDIGRDRIRRVGNDLSDSEAGSQLDVGFRAFKLSSSNIKPWDADFDSMENALLESIDNIKSDRTEDDVLYELLLKYGLDLAIASETRDIDGRKVTVIGAGALVVCLADDIALEVVTGIAALKDELKPEVMRVVFKDSGFADDVAKTNAAQILKQAGIDDVKSL